MFILVVHAKLNKIKMILTFVNSTITHSQQRLAYLPPNKKPEIKKN